MKITLKKCLAALGMVGLCVGLIGCGKSEGPVAESTVPLERGEHIMYGSYQGEAIEWRVLDKKGDKVLLLSEYGLDIQPFDTSDVPLYGRGRLHNLYSVCSTHALHGCLFLQKI